MKMTERQFAHVLAAHRFCQGKDLSHMWQFDETAPLTDAEIDDLCEAINCDENDALSPEQATMELKAFTVVGLFPDSEWDSSMWDASFVEHVTAQSPSLAARVACVEATRNRLIGKDTHDGVATDEEIQEMADNIEVLAVFGGRLMDLYDRNEPDAS